MCIPEHLSTLKFIYPYLPILQVWSRFRRVRRTFWPSSVSLCGRVRCRFMAEFGVVGELENVADDADIGVIYEVYEEDGSKNTAL